MALSLVPSSGNKRKEPGSEEQSNEGQIVAAKRTKTDLVVIEQRYSNLQAPIMQLTGHKGVVYTSRFNPEGDMLATASFDKTIFLWYVFGDCKNFAVLNGHKNAVLHADWNPDGRSIYSCSADKTVALWDLQTATRVRRFLGHTAVVHCVSMSPKERINVEGNFNILLSASDDHKIKLWDTRSKQCQSTIDTGLPVTSVQFNKAGDGFFSSGIDPNIHFWDLRKTDSSSGSALTPLYSLAGHTDTVTGLSLSPDGNFLLSNAMDSVVKIWDVRPYAEGDRNLRAFQGILHNQNEKSVLKCGWSYSSSTAGDIGGSHFVSAGSSDRFVTIWKTSTGEIAYRLPGHKGTVNDVQFHPQEPIVASCSNDRTIFLGEVDPKA